MSGGDYWMSYWTKLEEHWNNSTVPHREENKTVIVFGSGMSHGEKSSYEYAVSHHEENNTATAFGTWIPDRETSIYVYTGIIVAIIVLSVGSSLVFFLMSLKAAENLHNNMFARLSRATMRFFNTHPSGQILNRFSKDMGSVDEILPQCMLECIKRGLEFLGIMVVVVIVNAWLLIPTFLMLVLFYFLRVYYIASSCSIKRLEGITRSPVFSHLSASLQGLTTIRAFRAQTLLEKEFGNHQDLNTTASYLFVATYRAFGLWLDSVCVVYVCLVTLSFLVLGGEPSGGDVGLAITQVIGLIGMLQWGVRQSAEMENQMTSVERVLEFTGVHQEPPLESSPDCKPPDEWPSRGEIEFRKVFLAYSKHEKHVLQNISFTIRSGEKVGVVGRTGAGKSSLITALLRLAEISDGCIRIDGVDISTIGLHDLRSKISIIPQEPALFSGPLRDNLDPFNQFSDDVLWTALEEVELKLAVEELPSGLIHKVQEGGSNFSVGQRQLLCLARAIIKKNKILVLDEATANVDSKTDELIQATIRRKFADCTVLTIAHRLHTVMDSDRILVMDAGTVVEFDHPYELVKNRNGVLYSMVQQTGRSMEEVLCRIAQTSYERLQKRSYQL